MQTMYKMTSDAKKLYDTKMVGVDHVTLAGP